MGLCSSRAVGTRLAAFYAAGAAGPLTSELQRQEASCPTNRKALLARSLRASRVRGRLLLAPQDGSLPGWEAEP